MRSDLQRLIRWKAVQALDAERSQETGYKLIRASATVVDVQMKIEGKRDITKEGDIKTPLWFHL